MASSIGEIVNFIVRGSDDGAEELKATIAFGSEQAKARGERFEVKEWLTNFYGNIRDRVEERNTAEGGDLTSKQLDEVALRYLRNGVKYSSTEEGRALMKERGVDGATDFLIEKGYADVPGMETLAEAEVVEAESAPARPSRAGETSWGRMRQTPARDMTTIEEVETVETDPVWGSRLRGDTPGSFGDAPAEGMADTVPYSGSVLQTLTEARPEPGELGAPTSRSLALGARVPGIAKGTPSDLKGRGSRGGLMVDRPDEVTVDWVSEGPNAANKGAPFEGTDSEIAALIGASGADPAAGSAGGAEAPLGDSLGDLATMSGGGEGLDAALGDPTNAGGAPDAGLIGTGDADGSGWGSAGGWTAAGLGAVGIGAAIANTITDFRTTASLEDMLARSAAGETVARQEGRMAGGRMRRDIMATSLGRRDISPALGLRNAQMAAAPAMSDMYAQAAIASANERRQSEAQLAQLRKKRYDDLFGALMQTAGTVGSLVATQSANAETEDTAKRLDALERRPLVDVTGGRGRLRGSQGGG